MANKTDEKEIQGWRAVERGWKASAETGEWQIGLLPKKSISLRVEPIVIDWFRTQGGDYRALMRRVLKQYAADNAKTDIAQDVRNAQSLED